MNPEYLDTRFRTKEAFGSWPTVFAIITAHATTGERWTDTENDRADEQLANTLRDVASQIRRITGYSPSTGHAEPGWACEVPFHLACNIALQFRQDAIYLVVDGSLNVTYCDERRALVPVARFMERLDERPW